MEQIQFGIVGLFSLGKQWFVQGRRRIRLCMAPFRDYWLIVRVFFSPCLEYSC